MAAVSVGVTRTRRAGLARRVLLSSAAIIIALAVAIVAAAHGRVAPSVERAVVAAAIGAALASLIHGILLARSVAQPLEQLRDAALALARHDYHRAVPTEAPGEVGELAVALSQLAAQLEALETTRRDFVANVSHELRTPLTSVGGFAETLVADPDIPPEVQRQFAASILANAQRMQRIVDDLLDLSRIESGGWVPRPQDTDVRSAVDETVALVRDAAIQKSIRVDASVPDGASRAYADRTALRQILANLAQNAVRHTPAGGSVVLFSENARDGTWVGVRDNGEGIAPEHLPRIFERFYRVDTARSRGDGGTGLGLAIVRHLAEAHGGRVEAESAPGSGTTIRVFFPHPRRSGAAP